MFHVTATCFLEFWKRKQAEIQYDWDVAQYDMEEHIRPEFEAKCTQKKLNPVTQVSMRSYERDVGLYIRSNLSNELLVFDYT